MTEPICAILLHEEEYPLSGLKAVMEHQGINICRARSCREAAALLKRAASCVIFTDVLLPDGTWADVLNLTAGSPQPVPVVVVARLVDINFYVEVIERGAFDFITPPFTAKDVGHILRSATDTLAHSAFWKAGAA